MKRDQRKITPREEEEPKNNIKRLLIILMPMMRLRLIILNLEVLDMGRDKTTMPHIKEARLITAKVKKQATTNLKESTRDPERLKIPTQSMEMRSIVTREETINKPLMQRDLRSTKAKDHTEEESIQSNLTIMRNHTMKPNHEAEDMARNILASRLKVDLAMPRSTLKRREKKSLNTSQRTIKTEP